MNKRIVIGIVAVVVIAILGWLLLGGRSLTVDGIAQMQIAAMEKAGRENNQKQTLVEMLREGRKTAEEEAATFTKLTELGQKSGAKNMPDYSKYTKPYVEQLGDITDKWINSGKARQAGPGDGSWTQDPDKRTAVRQRIIERLDAMSK